MLQRLGLSPGPQVSQEGDYTWGPMNMMGEAQRAVETDRRVPAWASGAHLEGRMSKLVLNR